MTERKPAGMSFESWIDRQIREAEERGEFDNLPGKGKPIKGLDGPWDEMWWIKQMLVREDLSYTPPTLALRRDVEDTMAKVNEAKTEDAVRALVTDINARIREVNRKPMDGPPSNVMPFDLEQVIARWRKRHPT